MQSTEIKVNVPLSRVARGHYASADGKWAVVGDGADSIASKSAADSEGVSAGMNTSSEWEVVYSSDGGLREDANAGEPVRWASTLREGRDIVNREARKMQEKAAADALASVAVKSDDELREELRDEAEANVRDGKGDPHEPCVYGHFDCAYSERGACTAELVSIEFARLLDDAKTAHVRASAAELARAREQFEQTIVAARKSMSLRDVAEAAGISHEQVRRIDDKTTAAMFAEGLAK